MGYSLGGGVALRTAIQHPEVVRKLVLVSTPFNKSGWSRELQTGQARMGLEVAEAMRPTPLYTACGSSKHYSWRMHATAECAQNR